MRTNAVDGLFILREISASEPSDFVAQVLEHARSVAPSLGVPNPLAVHSARGKHPEEVGEPSMAFAGPQPNGTAVTPTAHAGSLEVELRGVSVDALVTWLTSPDLQGGEVVIIDDGLRVYLPGRE
jgi:hypothetical protein